MKTLIAVLALVSANAFAAQPPTYKHVYSWRSSCANVRQAVNTNGAVILHYGRDLNERVVAHQGYCEINETTRPFWAPSANRSSCFVGYICENRSGD